MHAGEQGGIEGVGGGGAGGSKNHVNVKWGSAKIKHGIFYIAPAPTSDK